MKTEIKKIDPCVRELIITIEADEVLHDYNSNLNQLKKNIVIPGFRKGKAPISMIERTYGDHLKDEFLNDKIKNYYEKAIDEIDLKPVSPGEYKKVDWEKGKDLIASFHFEIFPEIKINKYTNLEIPFEPYKFKEEMLDVRIEEFRDKLATVIDADSPSEIGDFISSKFCFLDENDVITKEIDRQFFLGDNPYSEEFNKKLTGKKIGDEIKTKLFDAKQESQDKDISSNIKDRNFLVQITSIKRKQLPEIDDDFAKDLEFESLQEMKEKITEDLKIGIEIENKKAIKEAIINKLIEENQIDIPNSIKTNYAREMAKSYSKSGQDDIEKILPIFQEIAEHNLKGTYLIQEILKKENIEVTDEDKENVIKEAAENLNMDVEKYKKMYKKQIESEEFLFQIKENKLFEIIEKSSTFVPYPKKEEEKK